MVESLRKSKIKLILTRHEQAAAFMAATHGRVTGTPGVCISTLGPGALNFSTGAAYAHLGAMPMVMITGQKAIMTAKQARFQIVDVIASMRPLTKMARQIISPASIPAIVRDAFRVTIEERPGPVHVELPEDVAGEETEDVPVIPPHPIEPPIAQTSALDRAAEMILAAERPLIMLGAGSSRPKLVEPLSSFVQRTRIPFFNTQMGKGSVTGGSNLYMGTAAMSSGDYVHRAIEHADLILTIGHDTVEKPPFIMGIDGPKVIHVGFTPANVEEVYFPHAEVVGDVGPSLALLADRLEGKLRVDPTFTGLRSEILGKHQRPGGRRAISAYAATHRPRRAKSDAGRRHRLPRQWHVQDLVRAQLPHSRREHSASRQRPGDDGSRASIRNDGRDTLSGSARPRVCGDGGFMMNSQEMETAVRLGLNLVVLILEDCAYGMIRWKQAVDKFPDWGLTFGNPDFVRYAKSYGAIGHRVKRTDDLVPTIESAFKETGVHLITVPIDYIENTRVLLDELQGRVPEIA